MITSELDHLDQLGAKAFAGFPVRSNERMLTAGFYAEVSLEYDPVIAQERNGRPFRIAGLRPIQMSNPNVLGILIPLGWDRRDETVLCPVQPQRA